MLSMAALSLDQDRPWKTFPKDIYTEPEPDVDTLANLGPLTGIAGIWTGARGLDVNPKADGPERQPYIEYMELQPIDAQTNGPQLFYGLRYHTRIVKPDDVETFHDQVGYWLWEPATGALMQTLSIPRGQVAMAVGRAAADAKTFRPPCGPRLPRRMGSCQIRFSSTRSGRRATPSRFRSTPMEPGPTSSTPC